MDPVVKFRVTAIRALTAALSKAEKDVAEFRKLRTSARKFGMDDFGAKVLLEHAYEQVRTLKDVIADISRRK